MFKLKATVAIILLALAGNSFAYEDYRPFAYLPAATSVAATDTLMVLATPSTNPAVKQITVANFSSYIGSLGGIVNLDLGSSGAAGTLDVFPATASKGKLTVSAVNNDGNTTTTITNAAMAQASVVSIPDPGAATANFLLTDQANDQSLVSATAAEINMAADVSTMLEEVTIANVITSAECGRTFVLNSATEFASTLPAIAGTGGCEFRFIVRGAPSGASYTIATAAETTNIIGGINEIVTAHGSGPSCVAAGGCDVITFVDGVSVAGDYVELISDGTNWYLSGQTAADGGSTVADTP